MAASSSPPMDFPQMPENADFAAVAAHLARITRQLNGPRGP
jgi:hypothetical protein